MEFNWCGQVYKVVKKIPRGKVSTYGNISNYIVKHKIITPRMVGWALHKNPDSKNTPCHRVVNAKGELAKNYAFGGWRKQKERLLKEGVIFLDKDKEIDIDKVDLGKCLWSLRLGVDF